MTSVLRGLKAGLASTQLTFTEGLTLHIIATVGKTNVKGIAQILRLERSWISRIVSSLQKKECVESFEMESDGRLKGLRITSVGKSLLVQLNEQRRLFFDNILSALKPQEVNELAELLRELASGYGSPPYPAALNPHPVDFELARLSWSIGVVGNDYVGTGLNVTQYHVMSVLAEEFDGVRVSVSDVHNLLPVDLSTLSRTLDAFESDGIVTKQQSKQDKRSFEVSLSSKGRKRYEEMLSSAFSLCDQACKEISIPKQKKLGQLLKNVTTELPTREEKTQHKHFELKQIRLADLTKSVQSLSGAGQYFSLNHEGKPLGILAVQPVKSASGTGGKSFKKLVLVAEDVDEQDCLALLQNGLKKL